MPGALSSGSELSDDSLLTSSRTGVVSFIRAASATQGGRVRVGGGIPKTRGAGKQSVFACPHGRAFRLASPGGLPLLDPSPGWITMTSPDFRAFVDTLVAR